MKSIITIILTIVILLGLTYLVIFGRALQQDENHLVVALNLPRVMIAKIVKLDGDKYLAKNPTVFITKLAEEGFTYREQMGSGYFFIKNNQNYISLGQMYSTHLMIFTAPVLSQ